MLVSYINKFNNCPISSTKCVNESQANSSHESSDTVVNFLLSSEQFRPPQ